MALGWHPSVPPCSSALHEQSLACPLATPPAESRDWRRRTKTGRAAVAQRVAECPVRPRPGDPVWVVWVNRNNVWSRTAKHLGLASGRARGRACTTAAARRPTVHTSCRSLCMAAWPSETPTSQSTRASLASTASASALSASMLPACTDEVYGTGYWGVRSTGRGKGVMGASRLAELAQRRGATKGAGEAHGGRRHLLCECARRPRALKSGRAQDDEGFELPSLVCAYIRRREGVR